MEIEIDRSVPIKEDDALKIHYNLNTSFTIRTRNTAYQLYNDALRTSLDDDGTTNINIYYGSGN